MKRRLNESAVKYIAYQVMLESGLTASERDRLFEAGIMDKVIGWLGAGTDTVKKLGGAAAQLFKNSEFTRRMVSAEQAIGKEIDDLKALAGKAGQPEEAVYGILKQILDKAGAPSAQIENPPAPAAQPASGGDTARPAAGTPVDPGKPEVAVPAIAGAAAEISGQDPDKAKEQAEEKGVDIGKALGVIGDVLVKVTKVDAAKDIVDYLFKNKKIQFEGRRRIFSADLPVIAKRIAEQYDGMLVMERWGALANLIVEEGEPAAPGAPAAGNDKGKGSKGDEVPPEAKKFISLIDQLVGRFKGIKKGQIAAVLTALDDTKGLKVVEK
jgi:hypothetical protein